MNNPFSAGTDRIRRLDFFYLAFDQYIDTKTYKLYHDNIIYSFGRDALDEAIQQLYSYTSIYEKYKHKKWFK